MGGSFFQKPRQKNVKNMKIHDETNEILSKKNIDRCKMTGFSSPQKWAQWKTREIWFYKGKNIFSKKQIFESIGQWRVPLFCVVDSNLDGLLGLLD